MAYNLVFGRRAASKGIERRDRDARLEGGRWRCGRDDSGPLGLKRNRPEACGFKSMAEIHNMEALLINALQDLHDAERAMAERLPAIADQTSDDAVRALFDEDAARSGEQQRRLAALLTRRDAEVDGAPNIWLRAILDDAERDTETVERGPLLDIALIGAIRKGKQSERVSYETAIALASAIGTSDAATLETIRDEEAATDTALADLLEQLAT